MSEGRENLLSQAEIDAALNEHPADRKKRFALAFDRYQGFNHAMLDMAVEAGLITREQAELWKSTADYVPFYRILDEEEVGAPGKKRGIANQRSGIRGLKGGTALLNDPIENMVMNMTKLVDSSMKNTAMRKVLKLALDAGVLETMPMDWRPVRVTPDAAATVLEDIGVEVQGLTKQQRDQMLTLFEMRPPKDKDVISVMLEGKPRYFRVHDPMLLRAITSMNPNQLGGVWRLFRMAKQVLTEGVTLDPAFMIANAMRDTLSAWVTTGQKGFTPGLDSAKGFAKALREDPSLVTIMAAGGGSGGFYRTAPKEVRRQIDRRLRHVERGTVIESALGLYELWHKLGAASEAANRIAIHDAIKKNGGTEAEAAYQALDLLDFSMRGDWAAVQRLTEVVPFLNARLQGLYRLGRGVAENPKAFLLRGAIIMAATMALLAGNWDNPKYEELEDWDKDTYWHVWVNDQHFRIPKPFEVGAIFATIPERMMRLALGKDDSKVAAERVLAMFRDTFAMNPTPQLLAPIIEQWANKDFFTGRDIVPQSLESLPPGMQSFPGTSETLKQVGEAVGVSPVRVQSLINGYLGTMGDYLLASSDVLVRWLANAPAEPTKRLDDYPVVKRFLREDPARSTVYITRFHEMEREVDQVVRGINEAGRRQDMQMVRELVGENTDKLAVRDQVNALAKGLGGMNAAIRATHYDRNMTPDAKRQRIDSLTAQRNRMIETGMRTLPEQMKRAKAIAAQAATP